MLYYGEIASVLWRDSISTVEAFQYCGRDSISTVAAIQYCEWIASVHVRDSISTVGDSISTVKAIQYCRVKFLIFLYLVDIANQRLSAIYNFETKILLDFYCN